MNEQTNLVPVMEVTIERNFDVLEKSWESKIFTKLHHSLRTSGLLAKLSDKDFRTLICLATFIDAEGKCFPSQETVARALGVSRSAACKRLRTLTAFRWKGKPLVHVKKVRAGKGTYDNNVYTVCPEAGVSIFDHKANNRNQVNSGHVADAHSNQGRTSRKILNNVTERGIYCDDPLASELARDMDDFRSLPYYRKIVRQVPASILLRARGEVLEEPRIRRSKGAMFAYLVKKHTAALRPPKTES